MENEKKPKKKKQINPIIFIVIGIIMIVGGFLISTVYAKQTSEKLERCTAETTAAVTKVSTDTSGDDIEYDTTVEFTIEGTAHRRTRSFSNRKSIGTVYTVKYNPDDPSEYVIVNFDSSPTKVRLMGIYITVLGAGVTYIGYVKKKGQTA